MSACVTYSLICALRRQSCTSLSERREALRNIAADRIDRILGLTSQLQVPAEDRPPRQLEYRNPHFVRELPDDQVLVVLRARHGYPSRNRDAATNSRNLVGYENECRRNCDRPPQRGTQNLGERFGAPTDRRQNRSNRRASGDRTTIEEVFARPAKPRSHRPAKPRRLRQFKSFRSFAA
jgi:hypothetical protein